MSSSIVAFKDHLASEKHRYEQMLPSTLTADRFISIIELEFRATPKLLDCDPRTVGIAIDLAATLGLRIGRTFGELWLIPYHNSKINRLECQAQIGFAGFRELAYRTGNYDRIYADAVYSKDSFSYSRGTTPDITHEPHIGSDPGEFLGVYAVAIPKVGGPICRFFRKTQVDKWKNAARGKSPAWEQWYEEMAQTKALKHLCKKDLRLSGEESDKLMAAIAADVDEIDTVPVVVQAIPARAPKRVEEHAQATDASALDGSPLSSIMAAELPF